MNFIQQAYTGEPQFWKYLLPTLGLFGLVILNSVVISVWELDTNEIMQQQILSKGANRVFFENLIMFVIFLGGLFIWVRFVHQQSIISLTTSRNKIDFRRIFFAFSLWAIITVGMVLYAYYAMPEDFVWNFNFNKFIVLALLSIVLLPIQTSFEEYFFRGYLMQGLGVLVKNRWFPLLFTSVTFGLMHMANPEVDKLGLILMVYYIGTGLFLGIITLMDEGLELALGFHAANNLVTALLVTTDWTAFQTDSILRDVSEPSAGFDIIVPVFILFPILLFVFAKKYGWQNWKEKLTGKIEKPVLID
ncbi:CPBP family intramembrane glutamic endopeptidase [Aureibaculum sp. 2210JD6-5]|uniref:CPBP family intramembrane glutamic endopeptidase n=1 Tax=Aureibaculum sp. 2210JD6-5 TaxID=3103957 RepID=UPI002AAD244D|nr:CPBP family intramembrane glutamic endopeptidase [Aureibaculum sp. 2210JD6-5]MDY7393646.1 CPBP family intramembrane glutamic endopeptidase [Aureibaculum sp. 2210JD6-5]